MVTRLRVKARYGGFSIALVDFRDTPEEARFREEVRSWLDANLPDELLAHRGGEARFDGPEVRAWSRALYDGGWIGISWPEEYGGRGLSPRFQAIYLEEEARAEGPPHIGVIGLGMAGPTIITRGTEAQKARYLQPLLAADEIWCQGFSEPGAGSDLAGVRTSARLGEALAPDLVRREERLQVAGLLRLGAAGDDRRPGHPEADHADVRRAFGTRFLLEVDRLEARREPAAAVLGRPGDPDPAAVVERPAPRANLRAVEPRRPTVVAAKLGGQVLVDPGANLGAERGLLRRVAEVHGAMLDG